MKLRYFLFASVFVITIILLAIFVFAGPTKIDGTYLDSSIISYYSLDETTGEVGDATGGFYNGTSNNVTRGVTGKIDKGYNFTDTSPTSSFVNLSENNIGVRLSNTTFTINFWFKPWRTMDSTTSADVFFDLIGTADRPRTNLDYDWTRNGALYFQVRDDKVVVHSVSSVRTYSAEVWKMITVKYNNTHLFLYENATLINKTANSLASGFSFSGKQIFLGWESAKTSGYGVDAIMDEFGFWNRSLNSTEISDLYNSGNGIEYGQIPGIEVTLNSPLNNSKFLTRYVSYNTTLTPKVSNLTNATLKVWYINGTLWKNVLNNSLSGSSAKPVFFNTSNTPMHEMKWNVYGCSHGATAVYCKWGATNRTYIIGSNVTSFTYSPSTYETKQENYSMNISVIQNYAISGANFNFAGTTYTATIDHTAGNNYTLSKSLDIPTSVGNKSISFNWTLNSSAVQSSDDYNQTVKTLFFQYCNATYSKKFLNFSFKDETTLGKINASNDLVDVDYWIGSGSVTKSYINSTTTPYKYYYAFCSSAYNDTMTIDMSFKYSGAGYPQRTFVYDNQLLTNATTGVTNKTLYLLSTADGIYSSLQVIEVSGAPISGTLVQLERQFSGVLTLVGQGTTGSDGLVTFWINPNYEHRITASKSGYTTNQVTITPSQTLYTLILSRTSIGATYSSQVPGLRYIVRPMSGPQDAGLKKFNVTMLSTESNLENCKFELVNATNSSHILSSVTSITNTSYCFLNINYNLKKDQTMFGRVSVDTTNTTGFVIINADVKWIGFERDVKGWRTIVSFFSDLRSISEFGEGEEGEFSRIVIFFVVITILLGVFTYFSGVELTNPGLSILIVWVVTLIASVGGFLTVELGGAETNQFVKQYAFLFMISFFTINHLITLIRRANE